MKRMPDTPRRAARAPNAVPAPHCVGTMLLRGGRKVEAATLASGWEPPRRPAARIVPTSQQHSTGARSENTAAIQVLPPNWSEHDVHDSLKQPMGLHDTLVGPLNHVLNQVFTRTSCKVLRVRDVPGPSDESGAPTVLASVTVRSPQLPARSPSSHRASSSREAIHGNGALLLSCICAGPSARARRLCSAERCQPQQRGVAGVTCFSTVRAPACSLSRARTSRLSHTCP